MEKLAKNINELILENDKVKEYFLLKKEIENDIQILDLKNKLDLLRKDICKNKGTKTSEYYELLKIYKNNSKIKRLEELSEEIKWLMTDISDILSLK